MSLEDRISEWPWVFGPYPQRFQSRLHRWWRSPSRFRWTTFIVSFASIVLFTSILLGLGVGNLKSLGTSGIWTEGFASIDPNAIFDATSFGGADSNGVFKTILITNVPQLLISTLYFMYNGSLMNMMCAREFTEFSQRPVTLRASRPAGEQRSTYWLSLPCKFSLPLIAISAALHWFLSRSLFLVQIEVMDWENRRQKDRDISACGFSPLAGSIVMAILTGLLLSLVACGFRRFPPGVPIVGTCSWAISAACHDLGGEKDAAMKPLMCGDIGMSGENNVGHRSKSSRKVVPPTERRTYA